MEKMTDMEIAKAYDKCLGKCRGYWAAEGIYWDREYRERKQAEAELDKLDDELKSRGIEKKEIQVEDGRWTKRVDVYYKGDQEVYRS